MVSAFFYRGRRTNLPFPFSTFLLQSINVRTADGQVGKVAGNYNYVFSVRSTSIPGFAVQVRSGQKKGNKYACL